MLAPRPVLRQPDPIVVHQYEGREGPAYCAYPRGRAVARADWRHGDAARFTGHVTPEFRQAVAEWRRQNVA